MRSVLFVNVENMDPQPVSFFKGSVTKVTRKFAVPLVHAAGVLEVFVPVVLVGKNFAAALTLEALPGFCTAEGKVPPLCYTVAKGIQSKSASLPELGPLRGILSLQEGNNCKRMLAISLTKSLPRPLDVCSAPLVFLTEGNKLEPTVC